MNSLLLFVCLQNTLAHIIGFGLGKYGAPWNFFTEVAIQKDESFVPKTKYKEFTIKSLNIFINNFF